jgi:hypothetical protein
MDARGGACRFLTTETPDKFSASVFMSTQVTAEHLVL